MRLIIFFFAVWMMQSVAFAQDTCRPSYGTSVVKHWSRNWGRMAYIEEGKGETLLFIHGLGGNISHWLKQVQSLRDQYHCVAIDLPGYGHSDSLPVHGMNNTLMFYASEMAVFIQQKLHGKVTLVGHSMGGQIAIITGLHHPVNVKQLVLAAPAGLEAFTSAESRTMIQYTPASFFQLQNEAVIRANYARNFHQASVDLDKLIQDRLRMRTCPQFSSYCEAISAGVKGMLNHPVRDSLVRLTMPTLVVFGRNDALIPNKTFHPTSTVELVAQEANRIPRVSIEFIASAGHLLQIDRADDFDQVLRKFLTSNTHLN